LNVSSRISYQTPMISRQKALGAFLATGLSLLALAAPRPVLASVHCQRSHDGVVLSISVTNGSFAEVRRAGAAIQVSDSENPKRGCRSGATVTNTDRIKLFAGEDAAVFVELSRGPFAPGLTPDEDGSSEIEWEVSGPGEVELVGGPEPDHFRYMDSGSESGLNLNADEDTDLDLVVARESLEVLNLVTNGGGGPDRIDAVGSPALEAFAIGGPGDDTLLATPSGSILEGGSGSDRLIGSPVADLLVPGRGADLVRAGAGLDDVDVNKDGSRDRINCGPGDDIAFGSDRLDHLVSCK
jgi:Ca2+-binding RTX toxin-like protein